MTGEEKKESGFELGNTKIYVSSQTLRYCSIRRLLQIGCFNSRTEDLVHLASQPGPLTQICSNYFLQYLKLRDIDKEKPWFRKEGDVKLECVPDIIANFLSFIEKEAKLNPVTLVFYSTAEYHELAYTLKLNKHFQDDFKKNVKSIVIYEHYKYKGSDKTNFQAIDVLLDVKIRVYSCDKLAELLRQLFVGSKKKEEDYFPLKPDFDKIPKIQVSYPRELWNMQPKYLLLSSVRVNFSRNDWKEEGSPLPREAYKKVVSMLNSPNKNCVSAFRNGMFRCNQPVIVKFKDLKEDTKSICYKGNILESYLAEGTCTLYSYNTVQFSIVVFKYDNEDKNCTNQGVFEYFQHKGVVDNELDVQAKVLDQDQQILEFTEKSEDDISEKKEDTRKFDLIVADIVDRKKNVAIRKNILKSVLVKLSPIGGTSSETDDDVTVSVNNVFMATYSSFQYKGLKIVNQIFCPVKDQSNLVRLVLTSTGNDFTLEGGNSIGMATPINQSNFSEALIQAFQHELDVTEFIIDAIKKRSEEDKDKQESNKRNKQDLKHASSNKRKTNIDKRDQIYDKREKIYDKRDQIYDKRDQIYEKRDKLYDSRDARDEIYGSRDKLYGSVDNQEVNLSDLGTRRKDFEDDHDGRRRDFENDHDSRRRDIQNDHGGKRRDIENDHGERRRDFENDHGGRRRDNENDHDGRRRDFENDHDGRRRDIERQDSGKNDYHHRDQGRERNRNDYERNRNDTRSDYDKQDYTDRRNTDYYDQDSSRQVYGSSEYPASTVNNFSQPPPPLGGSNSIEVFGERRPLSFK